MHLVLLIFYPKNTLLQISKFELCRGWAAFFSFYEKSFSKANVSKNLANNEV